MEVHDNPDHAKSDAKNALAIDDLEPLLRHITAIAQLTSPQI
jgi:3-deoxy-D-manno-octulosonic acid (KDO) 8-phosphate synthase